MKEENENNQLGKESGKFGLPEDYFQKSAQSIMNKIEWQEEHKIFPQLIALKTQNGFSLPQNYFSDKEQQLELLAYPNLNALEKTQAFSVPQDYFEELEIIQSLNLSGEFKSDAFINLNALKKENNFKVPEQYFLEKEAALKRNLQTKTKVISLFPKRMAYAAAALLLVVLGLWLYNIYFLAVQPVDCGTMACLDKQDLVKTKNLERLDDEQLYELVDPAALEKKLTSPEVKPVVKEKKDTSLNEAVLEEYLDDI